MKKRLSKLLNYTNSFWNTLNYCLRLSWKSSKFYTVLRIIAQIFNSVVGIATAFIGKYILNLLSGNIHVQNSFVMLVLILSLSVGLQILIVVDNKVIDYASGMHNDILEQYLNVEIMNKSIASDLELFDSPEFYDNLEMAKESTMSLVNVVWSTMFCISGCVTLISTLILVSKLNLLFTIILFVSTIPSAVLNQIYTKIIYMWSLDHIKEQRQMGYLSGITTNKNFAQDLRLYNVGTLLKNRYINIWKVFFTNRKKVALKKTVILTLLSVLPDICIFFLLLNLCLNVMHHINTIGDYSLYAGLLAQLLSSITLVISSIGQIYDNKIRIDSYKKFESIENKIGNEGKLELTDVDSIEFVSVSFQYPGTEKLVLKKISFRIENHQKVCIVGVNGAGKTTMFKLLLRFYDVTSGAILINGRNIKEYELVSLRKMFSCMFQQFVNFAFTLRENVTISDLSRETNESEVLDALEKADAVNIMLNAPNGLDSYVTRAFEAQGIELSGGQYQRLALARAFFRDTPVVLLDEPSASLDPEAEHKIFQALDRLSRDKITLLTSHHFSNVRSVDKIIVIENGEIIEQGTHLELIKFSNRYATLFGYQAEKYI